MIVHMTKDAPENLGNELTDADAREMLGLFEEYFPEDYSLVKYEFQKLHPERFEDTEDDEMINLDDEIIELVWREKFEEYGFITAKEENQDKS